VVADEKSLLIRSRRQPVARRALSLPGPVT